MDASKAGRVIAEQLEAIEAEYGGSEEHEIGAVITILEITGPESSQLRLRHNLGGQPYRLLGYLRVAEEQALGPFRGRGGESA